MAIKFKRINDLRIDNDLTQKQMANVLNTTRDVYAQWERGFCNFPLDKINKYANFFQTSLDYITGLSNHKINYPCHKIDHNLIKTRIKQLRKNYGLSQDALCQKINVKQRTYSGYENGRSIPPLSFLFILAKFYNVSLDYLTGRKKDINIQ